MLALEMFILVADLADVDPVDQEVREPAARPSDPAPPLLALARKQLGLHTIALKRLNRRDDRTQPKISIEDQPDRFRFALIYDQFAVLNIVSEWHWSSDLTP
jgi:hypothetical protein